MKSARRRRLSFERVEDRRLLAAITSPSELTSSSTIIDFEELPRAQTVGNPLVIEGVTFSSPAGLSSRDIREFSANGSEVEGNVLHPISSPEFNGTIYPTLTISFDIPVAEALLGWWDPNFEGNVLRAFDVNGELIEEAAVELGPSGGVHAVWIGFSRDVADIASLEVTPPTLDAGTDVYGIDNLHFNSCDADYCESFNQGLGGWTAGSPTWKTSGGVNDSGYFEASRTRRSPVFNSTSGDSVAANGNLAEKYGDTIEISYFGRVFEGGDLPPSHGFYDASLATLWQRELPFSIEPLKSDWQEIQFAIDPTWTDSEAEAEGWIVNSNTTGGSTWAETMRNVGLQIPLYALQSPDSSVDTRVGIDEFKIRGNQGEQEPDFLDYIVGSIKQLGQPGGPRIDASVRSTGIVLNWKPNFPEPQRDVAALGGYENFNFYQEITSISLVGFESPAARQLAGRGTGVDPLIGGNNTFSPADMFPWYYDEVEVDGGDPTLNIEASPIVSTEAGVTFQDFPNLLIPGPRLEFATYLAAVNEDNSGSYFPFPGTGFKWAYTGTGFSRGDVSDVTVLRNTDPSLGGEGVVEFLGILTEEDWDANRISRLQDAGLEGFGVPEFAPVVINTTREMPGYTSEKVRLSSVVSSNDDSSVIPLTVDWGDGTEPQIVELIGDGAFSFSLEHEYASGGVFDIKLSVVNDTGVTRQTETQAFITGARLADGELQIVGTPSDDVVRLWVSNDAIRVDASFSTAGVFPIDPDKSKISVHLGNGDDKYFENALSTANTFVDAGSGNDIVKGGGGNDLLVGGAGFDTLLGGFGDDLVVGGGGADLVLGNSGEDVLIGGSTTHDDNLHALQGLFREWTNRNHSYETRIANITGDDSNPAFNERLNGSVFLTLSGDQATVFDDEERDLLFGGLGRDWFFKGTRDWLIASRRNERVDLF